MTQTALKQENETLSVKQDILVNIDRALLLKALGHVQSVVERRNTLPILANVKIEVENGSISLTATDTDIEITEKISAQVKKEGAITVPAHVLYDIVRKLPDGSEVELKGSDAGGGKLQINSGNCNFNLASLPVNDFPVMDQGDVAQSFKLSPAELIALIDKTKFAISTEETRYYLNGIFLHTRNNEDTGVKLSAVATDGHRLAKVEIDAPEGAEEVEGVIIPRKTVGEIRKLADESAEEIEVKISGTKISFNFGNASLISKLIDGSFPDYEKVIPSDNDKTIEIEVSAFAKAVDRVATISSEKTRTVKLSLQEGKLTILATGDEHDSAREELESPYEGIAFDIGFNSRYLLDMLAVLEGGQISISFKDGNAPALVKDSKDSSAVFVIMPIRI